MHFHFHVPHFNVLPRHTTTHPADVEAGRRNITGPTLARKIDDVLNGASAYNFQPSGSPEVVKIYRLLPIFSGVMIPLSIMLSIPSLTGHWYIRTENNVTTEIRPNPLLLDVALGFSMAFAILASVFLVLRFAERCVKHMTLASIVLIALHDLINIPAVTIFGVIHRFDDGFTYGESFWFTVYSTIISTATNIILVVDYVITKDFAASGSGLTSKQRSLVIIVMILLSYISLGSFIGTKLLDIPFLNALYFSVVSIETIGFGDIYPRSTGARIFTCFYIMGGIMNIALTVTIARDVILESTVIELQRRLRARHEARRLRSRWRAAVRWRLKERGLPAWIHHRRHDLPQERQHHQRWYNWIFELFSRFASPNQEDPAWKLQYGPRQKRLNIDALSDADWNAAALETGAPLSKLVPETLRIRRRVTMDRPPGVPLSNRPTIEIGHGLQIPTSQSLTHFRLGGMLALLSNFAAAVSVGAQTEPGITPNVESNNVSTLQGEEPSTIVVEKRHEEVDVRRAAPLGVPLSMSTTFQEDDHNTEASLEIDAKHLVKTRLYLAFSLFIIFWLSGSAIFMKTEMWTFWDAAYFCFISFTTVGYGDLTPKSPAGLSIFVVWALLGVATVTIIIAVLLEVYSQRFRDVMKSEAYHPSLAAPVFRPPLSKHTTFSSGSEGSLSNFARYSSIRRDTVSHESGRSTPTIKVQESVSDGLVESLPEEFQPDIDSTQCPPIQMDHLKSLITMARAECKSGSTHLENLISSLENTFFVT